MKKLIILLLAAFFTNGMLAQNPCDTEMADTLNKIQDSKQYLKDFSWSNEDSKQRKKENSIMLRQNTKYSWRVGNSVQSETSFVFEFINVETKTSKGEERKFTVTNKAGRDTTITIRPTKHEPTGKVETIKKLKIAPGEASKFDVTIPVTGVYKTKITSVKDDYVCSHFALFFVEKVSDD